MEYPSQGSVLADGEVFNSCPIPAWVQLGGQFASAVWFASPSVGSGCPDGQLGAAGRAQTRLSLIQRLEGEEKPPPPPQS